MNAWSTRMMSNLIIQLLDDWTRSAEGSARRQHVRRKGRTPNFVVRLFKAKQEVDLSRTTTKPRQLSSEASYVPLSDSRCFLLNRTTDDSRRLRSRLLDGRRSAEVEAHDSVEFVWLTLGLLIEGLLIQWMLLCQKIVRNLVQLR